MNFIQNIDNQIIEAFNNIVGKNNTLDFLLRFFAEYFVLVVPISLPLIWILAKKFYKSDADKIKSGLLEATIAGVLGWQIVNRIIKAFYFRPRPYDSGNDFKELFFHRPDESFPSDHTTLLFTLTTYFYLLGWTKAGNWSLVISLIIGFARITTAIHWPTDILGGAIVGAISALIIFNIQKPLREKISMPVVNLVKKIGL